MSKSIKRDATLIRMGKFGRHSQFIIDLHRQVSEVSSDGAEVEMYVVPYKEICNVVLDDAVEEDDFIFEWRRALSQGTTNFERIMTKTWQGVFKEISSDPEAIGAVSDEALRIFTNLKGYEATSKLLSKFRDMHNTAVLNAEALRKLVRKFDKKKRRTDATMETLSEKLLPSLYTANFVVGLASIESSEQFLRESLAVDKDSESWSFRSALTDEERVSLKADELAWFRESIENVLTDTDLKSIVAHRGFHCTKDTTHLRPIENTLASFEYAWTSGICLCECDVGLTKDEKIVMAHDKNFARLALSATHDSSIQHVSDLTLKEIMALPLKSGTRPPLLIDSLRSAMAIGNHAKLVIEIKPGNTEMCDPLVNLFARHLVMLGRVAVIMSFDLYIMEMLCEEILELSLAVRAKKTNSAAAPTKSATAGRAKSFWQRTSRWSATFDASAFGKETELIKPKLLLLTTCEKDKAEGYYYVSVSDFTPIDDLMSRTNLDGVYLEYEPAMLEPDGQMAMRELAAKYAVGVWMDAKRDPDKLSLCRKLIEECHVSFVNSDFPGGFFEE